MRAAFSACHDPASTGLDHTRLNFTHNGRPERLTDPEVTGARVVTEVLA